MVGPACVVDVSENTKNNSDYQATQKDVEEWEVNNGIEMKNCILILRTGWYDKYHNRTAYFGTQNLTDTHSYHFPGIVIRKFSAF